MLKDLTSSQLSEWEAYDRLDPIGKWRDELGFATVLSLITNIVNALYSKKGTKPKITTAEDFMIKWGEDAGKVEPKKQSVEEMKAMIQSLAAAFGTKEKKEKPKNIKKDG